MNPNRNLAPHCKAIAFALALAACAPAVYAQNSTPAKDPENPVNSPYFVNPRSGPDDPRVGLKGGLYDPGTAASGLQLVLTTPKPAGFAPDVASIKAATPPPPPVDPDAPRQRPAPGAPAPTGPRADYGGTNSDLAFNSKYLFNGNYYGINIYDIADPTKMNLVTSIVCPGGQGDVSVYGHLLFMSVESANGRMDCGTQGFPTPANAEPRPTPPGPDATPEQIAAFRAAMTRMPPADKDRVKGIRIFDISDIHNPKQVVDVQTCRGSHTHTLVLDPKDKDDVYLYVAGSAGVRPKEELAGCSGGAAGQDPDTALFTIVVIKVPLAHPELAKVVASPRIFSDPESGKIDALKNAPIHGQGEATATRGCHDITVYQWLGVAGGACSGNGILMDIKDPVHPTRLDAVSDPNYAFWHSANFSNDGKTVLFTDEWGGGGQPRCRISDPMRWGADAIFSIEPDKKLKLDAYYKMPAPQTDKENCVAHNGSIIPVPGRDILVQSWYQGGVSIMDFTDPSHPFEIGYFDRGPVDDSRPAMGGQWSTYYYNGYIYGSEIARGTDVFKLVPTKFLTQDEIAAAAQINLPELNVQNQPHIDYPMTLVTAKAYLDQLSRGTSVPATMIDSVKADITANAKSKLHADAKAAEKASASAKTPKDAERLKNLAKILAAA
jgi:hypothetical protein